MLKQLRLIHESTGGKNFEDIVEKLSKYDSKVWKFKNSDNSPAECGFLDFDACVFNNYGLFLGIVNSRLRRIIFPRVFNLSLIISIRDDLSYIAYIILGKDKMLRIWEPSLVLPCNCNLPGRYRGDSCPLHSSEFGKEVYRLFLNGVVMFVYDGIIIYYKRTNILWPPNMDSLYMLYLVRRKDLVDTRTRTVLDLGSGTGILGIYLLKKFPHITHLYFSDIFITPIYTSIFNAFVNISRTKKARGRKKIRGFISDVYDNIPRKLKFDLVISNPPYLPNLGVKDVSEFRTVFDSYIVKKLIIESESRAKSLIFSASSISYDMIKDALDSLQDKNGISYEILGTRPSPLKFPHNFCTKEYVDKLIQYRKNRVRLRESDAFKIWHDVYYFLISY